MLLRKLCAAIAVIAFSALMSACSSGVAEYQLYTTAFDTQFTQGEQFLDRLAAAERVVVVRNMEPGGDFNPNYAAYYVDVGDPPATGAIRQALIGLKAYNDALTGLASGESSDAMVGHVGTIITNLTGAAGNLGAAGILPGLEGGAALSGGLSDSISSVLPVFKTIAGLAARESFRRRLIETYPRMESILRALHDGTRVMFEVIRRSYRTPGGLSLGSGGMTTANAELLEKDRQMLAGWVILLDKTLDAMKAATQAAMQGASASDLAALSEASVQLKVLAEQVKSIKKP